MRAPYPHEGGCPVCRALKVCNYCGKSVAFDTGRCTNGRCGPCHAKHCAGKAAGEHGYGVNNPRTKHEAPVWGDTRNSPYLGDDAARWGKGG